MLEAIDMKIRSCMKCKLWKTRKMAVPGEGFKETDIMFIGEAPGSSEDEHGVPFIGRAGSVFDDLLRSIDARRTEVYTTNILKCRPPKNVDPTEKQIKICTHWLNIQIDIIKPKVIITLGNFATQYIMEKFGLFDKIQGITKIKGKVFKAKKKDENEESLFIVPLFHPAVATYSPSKITELKKDFQILLYTRNYEDLCEE